MTTDSNAPPPVRRPSATDDAQACVSCLQPGYTPRTLPDVARWATAATLRIKEVVAGSQLKARARAFRWPEPPSRSSHILELSITDELGNCHAISFTAGSKHNLHLEEPEVPDLVEALHMLGLITRRLKVQIDVGDLDMCGDDRPSLVAQTPATNIATPACTDALSPRSQR